MVAQLLPSGHSETTGECPDCGGLGHVLTTDAVSLTEASKTRDATVKPKNRKGYDRSRNLRYILEGEEVFGAKTWDYLRPLTEKGAGCFDTHEVNFPRVPDVETEAFHMGSMATGDSMAMDQVGRLFPFSTTIVGNSYRDAQQQSALRNKNQGNRVLIIPEPANLHDPHAMAVIVAKGISQQRFVWTHVGYVPRTEAKELAKIWPRYRGRLLVGEGRLVDPPSRTKNPRIVIEGSFRNYFPE